MFLFCCQHNYIVKMLLLARKSNKKNVILVKLAMCSSSCTWQNISSLLEQCFFFSAANSTYTSGTSGIKLNVRLNF